MRRGILILNKEELLELIKYVKHDKLTIALENICEENKILINDEDLEYILDEIGRPEDNEFVNNILRKISDLLLSLGNR